MIRDAAHIPQVNSGSYPLREGCRVRPLVDGEPAFRRICQAVEAARSRRQLKSSGDRLQRHPGQTFAAAKFRAGRARG
jgi:hypothetical protein